MEAHAVDLHPKEDQVLETKEHRFLFSSTLKKISDKTRSEGLIRMFCISFPLILCSLSSYLTSSLERMLIGWHAPQSLEAIATASALSWAFFGGVNVLTGMAEAYIARQQGAGQITVIGKAVWQMIWFSLGTGILFIPLGLWGYQYFYAKESLQAEYFSLIMLYGPLQPLFCTLAAFLAGRGKIRKLVMIPIYGAIIQLIISWSMMQGILPWLPRFDVRGAAIASIVSQALQVVWLFAIFFCKEYRALFKTRDWKFDFPLFKKLFSLCFPAAVLYNIEAAGWSYFYSTAEVQGGEGLRICCICQGLTIFFVFFGEGLSRAVMILANYSIGQGRKDYIGSILKNSTILSVVMLFIECALLWIFPSLWQGYEASFSLLSSVMLTLIFLLLQNLQWNIGAILYALGDSIFVTASGSIGIWVFLSSPIFVLGLGQHYNAVSAWTCVTIYAGMIIGIYLWRLKVLHAPRPLPTSIPQRC